MVVVPAKTPPTTPVEVPTVATPGVPLAHTPPLGVPFRVTVVPTQTVDKPEIAGGAANVCAPPMVNGPPETVPFELTLAFVVPEMVM